MDRRVPSSAMIRWLLAGVFSLQLCLFIVLLQNLSVPLASGDLSPGKTAPPTLQKALKEPHIPVYVGETAGMDPHFAAAPQEQAFADMLWAGLHRCRPVDAPAGDRTLAAHAPASKRFAPPRRWMIRPRHGAILHVKALTPPNEITAEKSSVLRIPES